ncbi:non-specific serine/threonine protein kinase [Entamoeba marina]
MEFRVADQFKLKQKIGGGSFGEIYSDLKVRHLLYEYRVYSLLFDEFGFPKILHYGTEGDYNCLVMQLLGPSLEDYLKKNQKLSILSTCVIAEQLLTRFEIIHSKSIIHRDVKPNNFLVENGMIYVIDFGLSKRYRKFETHQHIPIKDVNGLIGTARFASINAHKGIELSRRDDLESLGYLFIYLLKGELPWQDLQPTLDGRYSNIGEMKVKLPLSDLCGELPTEFSSYILYCRELQFNQKPDYLGLRLMFKRLLQRLSSNPNDWVIESIQ